MTLELNALVASSDPHSLVSLLYVELQRTTDLLVRLASAGPVTPDNPQVNKAISILIALEAGLDFEAAGDLARILSDVYRSMRKEVLAAVAAQDNARLAKIGEAVTSLRNAWAAIRTSPLPQ